MKKLLKMLMVLVIGISISASVKSQPPGRPPSGGAGIGYAGNQNPLGAPVGTPIEPGTGILLILAAGYGFAKIKGAWKTLPKLED